MDGNQFDRFARELIQTAPRRQVLGAIIAGATAIVSGSSSSAARRRKRHNRGEEESATAEGAGTIGSLVPPGVLSGGIWEETLNVCHFDPTTGEYHVIPVSTVSVPEYLNAGDTLYIDCCVDAECRARQCYIPTGCIEGACAFDVAMGASCDAGGGVSGVCDKEGYCAPVTVPGGGADISY